MRIIQIVPRLPPKIDGVGDYAYCLAQQMRQDFGIQSDFIVGDPNWGGPPDLDGFPVTRLDLRSTGALSSLLKQQPSSIILLHYVGYGYNKRGCPLWLVQGLEDWKHSNQNTYLVTMFHEISASGPIWTSTFWLSSWQRYLAGGLVRVSDRLVTSKQLYAKILQKVVARQTSHLYDGHKLPILALPVFSNVGEPDTLLPLTSRDRPLVVFGGATSRFRVYKYCQMTLKQVCQKLRIEHIFDIGPTVKLDLLALTNLPIQVLGEQPLSDVSRMLANSLVGFIDYPTDFLGKSTIFASYCAHGMLPVIGRFSGEDADGLETQKHYWFPDKTPTENIDMMQAQTIANNAHNWYQNHSIPRHSQVFSGCLRAAVS